MKNRIYLCPPHMGGEEAKFIQEAFDSNWIAPVGPQIEAFEREICEFTGAQYALAVSSGTAAIHLSLILARVGAEDEVLCSSFTFAGSAFPVIYQRAMPVFVDSEQQSWNMDPNALEDALKDRKAKGKLPKALILVHLYGQSADFDAIQQICDSEGIQIIEDAAESLGATYRGRMTGTLGTTGVFSFNGNKIITTSGGGMLVSETPEHIEKARFLATQARDPTAHYEHREVGYNYRMSNVASAIGRGQLKVLEKHVEKHREVFETYKSRLCHVGGIAFMPEAEWGRSTRWLSCITVDGIATETSSVDIRLALERENIECRPLWKPMHLQPVFQKCPFYGGGVSERLFEKGLCLPSGSSLSDSDQDRIIRIVLRTVDRRNGKPGK